MSETTGAGCRLFYTVDGPADAPVLLLSNAVGSTSALWDAQMPAFTRDFRVVRYHTRGHPQSELVSGAYTLRDLGEDAVRVLDAVGATRAHVCGSSLGGLTAMWLGLHASARVDRLVFANTAARIGSAESWQQRIDLVRAQGLSSLVETAPTRWFTDSYRANSANADTIAAAQAMLASCSPEGYIACCAALRDADLRDDIANIAAPVLVINGTDDPSTPPANGHLVRDRIPDAVFLELPASHFSNIEVADRFNDAVLQFLGRDHDGRDQGDQKGTPVHG
jgi:3-oxoadipate enol-lactonase